MIILQGLVGGWAQAKPTAALRVLYAEKADREADGRYQLKQLYERTIGKFKAVVGRARRCDDEAYREIARISGAQLKAGKSRCPNAELTVAEPGSLSGCTRNIAKLG